MEKNNSKLFNKIWNFGEYRDAYRLGENAIEIVG